MKPTAKRKPLGRSRADGLVNMDDIQAAIQSFEHTPGAPHWTWIDVAEQVPDTVVNLTDIQFIIFGFQSDPYPFADPAECP